MARRSGGVHKCVEEKRRMLPIYQHYTLSPGRTKSHHPEAKCIHCLKEFVCGSKQRLIRHLRKCNSITNPDQIIAETLNTLARSSATGQLNHSILEASNLLPSQISHLHNSVNQQLVGGPVQQSQHYQAPSHNQSSINQSPISSSNSTLNTSNTSVIVTNNNNGDRTIHSVSNNNNVSGSSLASNDLVVAANNSQFNGIIPVKKTRRGRKPGSQHGTNPGIQVTTGLDGKTQFTPVSQLQHGMVASSPQIMRPLHNGDMRASNTAFATASAYHNQANIVGTSVTQATATSPTSATVLPAAAALSAGHQIHVIPYKLNSEPIDRAYLKLVITRNLPLSLCDTREFHQWIKTFANDYKPPSSINLVAHNMKHEAQSAKQRVSNILAKAPKKTINLELHCWHDNLRGHLWHAIIASIDTRRFLISVKDAMYKIRNVACVAGGGATTTTSTITTRNRSNINNNGSLCQSSNDTSMQQVDYKILTEFIDDCIKKVGSDRVNSLMFTGRIDTELEIVKRARETLYSNHPSIVTYYCWWSYTNQLCSDIFECDPNFSGFLKKSNLLITYISRRPQLFRKLEKFSPFVSVAEDGSNLKKDDSRWFSNIICYMLDYIKINHDSILKALEDFYPLSETSLALSSVSDSNNNSSRVTSSQASTNVQLNNGNGGSGVNNSNNDSNLRSTQQQNQISSLHQERNQLMEIKSIIMSADYCNHLNSALAELKPFKNIVALAPPATPDSKSDSKDDTPLKITANDDTTILKTTPAISANLSNNLSLSDYMHWFLNYGKNLIDSWRQSSNSYKYELIGCFIRRFNNSLGNFRLLFAAYLLNPKYRCAYVTQRAKDLAIEEILNIASEFMPEESDGHAIFDQWKLYLVREEPYDMIFDDNRSNALDWWMSIPCAESIRRVALRILRMKAYSAPRLDDLFSQLHYYENETKTSLNMTSFEDVAILRYFYDYEDRQSAQTYSLNHSGMYGQFASNGLVDRPFSGHIHAKLSHESNDPASYLPNDGLDSLSNASNVANSQPYVDALSAYTIDHVASATTINQSSTMSLDNLVGYEQFVLYIDFEQSGIPVVEVPTEKKKRKWTAKEILSKCQANHNNNSSSATNNNTCKVSDK